MYDHHLWATEALIDHLGRLPASRLDRSIPGTYGSMIDTLTHMIDGDSHYLLRLRDPTPPLADDRVGVPLAQLRSEMPEHRRRGTRRSPTSRRARFIRRSAGVRTIRTRTRPRRCC